MWFKNAQLFRFKEPFTMAPEQFNELLEQNEAKPCGKTQQFSFGWVSPFGKGSDVLMHAAGGYYLFAASREEKVLPAAVVRQALDEKVEEIELAEDRKVSAKQKRNMRDELEFTLLQQAFTKKQVMFGYIDTKNQLLCIDTSSRNKAEEFTVLLRKSLGRLPIVPLQVNKNVSTIMSSWVLKGDQPSNFEIDTSCEMHDPEQENSVIKCVQQNLSDADILSHLKSGMKITRLSLIWNNKLSLALDSDFGIKRIRFLDMLQEQRRDVQAESQLQQIDADFTIMTQEFSQLFEGLFEAFGGLAEIPHQDVMEEALAVV